MKNQLTINSANVWQNQISDNPYLGDHSFSYTTRTSKGRKRTVTAVQQRREKIKRKNRR